MGNAPDSEKVGAGKPVAVTVKVPPVPTVNVALLELVIAGAASTVRVNCCSNGEPALLDAVNVIGYVPLVPACGFPLKIPVEGLKVTPFGSAPDSESVGVGEPVAVTVKLEFVPIVKVALFALVMLGADCWLLD